MIFICLVENNYQQDRCQNAIEAMLDCCEQNADKQFSSCDGFKFQIKKRADERLKKQQGKP